MSDESKTGTRHPGSKPRRDFIKGIGVTAAAALGGLATDAVAAPAQGAAQPLASGGPLTDCPLVMLWRRVSALQKTKAFVGNVLRLPSIGEDPVSIIYDAGSALVGYAIPEIPYSNDPVLTACSEVGFQDFFLQNNPASSLQFVPSDFSAAVRDLHTDRNLAPNPERTDAGETLRFVDDDGNFSSFYKPSLVALRGEAGRKLDALLKERWSTPAVEARAVAFGQPTRAEAPVRTPVVGLELLVSDIARSKRFYAETLGLRLLDESATEAKFDAGQMILTLRVEPTNMLVQFLRKSGRLLGDWFVFHTENIKGTSKALEERSVAFPAGVETSLIGDVAYFNDPDGYSLVLWQPSGQTKMIDFNPALKRILQEVTGKRSLA